MKLCLIKTAGVSSSAKLFLQGSTNKKIAAMDTIYILWLRQMKKFRQSGVRMIISVVQPLVYFLALGYGLNSIFQQSGHGSYIQFIVPGVIAQTTLFSCI